MQRWIQKYCIFESPIDDLALEMKNLAVSLFTEMAQFKGNHLDYALNIIL
jgi:hypothetical protein